MRRFLTFIVLAALAIWGVNQFRARGDAGWQKLDNGLEVRQIQRRSGLSTFTITAVRAPAARVSVVGGDVLRVPQWAAKTGAVAAINGGYFDDKSAPIGLRVESGQRTNAFYSKANWGVFTVRDGRATIVHTRDYQPSPRTRQALQCGPRLVVDSQVTDLKPQWARRSGIGVDARNRVILAVCDGALSFDDWAKIWASAGGLGCRDALNLDGGPSTQLTVRSKTRPIAVRGGWPVPDAIILK